MNELERDMLEYCEFASCRCDKLGERGDSHRRDNQYCRYFSERVYCPFDSSYQIRRILEVRRRRIFRQEQ